MKKLTILFDADDTVENLSDCWIAMLNERYGTSVTPEDVHGWDISLAFPTLTKEQVFGVLPVSYTHLTLPTICSV